jgi:hypothetical protein
MVEHLPRKHEALSSNFTAAKKKKKKKRRKEVCKCVLHLASLKNGRPAGCCNLSL